MGHYTLDPYCVGEGRMVLRCSAASTPHLTPVKPDLPGAIILVHGVNDTGTSYDAVEPGLCKGLSDRLGFQEMQAPYISASYCQYDPANPEHAKALSDDPDAVFFKRNLVPETHSPVIPFYWGYREDMDDGSQSVNGQKIDQYGNRLDKDGSKGGGPFANATSTLADMWNSGAPHLLGLPDRLTRDPLRPVLKAPGRMYMVLAAKRLATLIAMIRDCDADDAVSIVAHSQGCLVSLLAQAFLMDQKGARPADTLILTHPPYSLHENVVEAFGFCHGGGEDAAMAPHYGSLRGQQSVRARLETLVNIVQGVAKNQKAGRSDAELKSLRDNGVHSGKWVAETDRDNRGKVYLYFCPEDMTVALPNVQGIGWQGVPDTIEQRVPVPTGPRAQGPATRTVLRRVLDELGGRFLQRVFTAKQRTSADGERCAFQVGLAPQRFRLREQGEDDQGHANPGTTSHRKHLPDSDGPDGLRFISGEPLTTPVDADMTAGSVAGTGRREAIDAIDAAIAVTSQYGLKLNPPCEIDDPRPDGPSRKHAIYGSLHTAQIREVEAALNHDKPEGERIKIERAEYNGIGKLTIERYETPDEARLRFQGETSDRSFHSAIIGSRYNHAKVTAYDVTVGQGTAVSHPDFYRYLCAVADWRMIDPTDEQKVRPGVLTWERFLKRFSTFWSEEVPARKKIIEGNCQYYTKGKLPNWLPNITQRPAAVVCETAWGRRTEISGAAPQADAGSAAPSELAELDDWRNVRIAKEGELDGNMRLEPLNEA